MGRNSYCILIVLAMHSLNCSDQEPIKSFTARITSLMGSRQSPPIKKSASTNKQTKKTPQKDYRRMEWFYWGGK